MYFFSESNSDLLYISSDICWCKQFLFLLCQYAIALEHIWMQIVFIICNVVKNVSLNIHMAIKVAFFIIALPQWICFEQMPKPMNLNFHYRFVYLLRDIFIVNCQQTLNIFFMASCLLSARGKSWTGFALCLLPHFNAFLKAERPFPQNNRFVRIPLRL